MRARIDMMPSPHAVSSHRRVSGGSWRMPHPGRQERPRGQRTAPLAPEGASSARKGPSAAAGLTRGRGLRGALMPMPLRSCSIQLVIEAKDLRGGSAHLGTRSLVTDQTPCSLLQTMANTDTKELQAMGTACERASR